MSPSDTADAAALRAAFLEELSVTSRKLRTLFDARVRARGLTLARARTLIHLARRDGMSQTDLAEILEIEGPTLVRLLDGLEGQGLIARRPMAGDRRAKRITLTDPGRSLAAEVKALGDDLREEVLLGIDANELAAATAVLRCVARRLSSPGASETDAA